MRKKLVTIASSLITAACAFAGGILLFPNIGLGQAVLLPPPIMPPDFVALTPEQKLGKFMLYDTTLSDPPGYACATCHVPETSFTGPVSWVNELWGPQPGVVLGRIGDRKPQSYVYAVFSPIGPYFDNNAGVWIGGDFWDVRVPDLATQALQPPINPNEKDMFTIFFYANIGTPKNPLNPFYLNINSTTNPHGYNPLGFKFIDWGLGGNPNPAPDGTRFYNTTPGDILQYRGLFKTASTRQSDQRPSPDFVKAYMHNGVFKSLEEVVHFYNKRNIAVDANGNEVAFDLRVGPPAGYYRLFPPPEVLDNVQNVVGYTPAQAIAAGTTGVTAANGQVGNLGLTPQQETDVVNFLKILSDGYTAPNPVLP